MNKQFWRSGDTAPRDGTPFWAFLFERGLRRLFYMTAQQIAEEEGGTPDEYEAGFCEVDDHSEVWKPKWLVPLALIPLPEEEEKGR